MLFCFISTMLKTARAGSGQSQEPKTHSGSTFILEPSITCYFSGGTLAGTLIADTGIANNTLTITITGLPQEMLFLTCFKKTHKFKAIVRYNWITKKLHIFNVYSLVNFNTFNPLRLKMATYIPLLKFFWFSILACNIFSQSRYQELISKT